MGRGGRDVAWPRGSGRAGLHLRDGESRVSRALQAEEAQESWCPGIRATPAVGASARRGALEFSDTEVTSESTIS